MKKIILSVLIFLSLSSYSQNSDTLKIKNDSLEYEVTIVYPGFDVWLQTSARPRGFYSLEYLETQNKYYVQEWNYRHMSSNWKNDYQFYIFYENNKRYGYEVNYLLFNYFQYFMIRTGEKIGLRKR